MNALLNLHVEFRQALEKFKEMLNNQTDTNLKYLEFRLDFNEYYISLKHKAEMNNMGKGGGPGLDPGRGMDYLDDDDDDDEDYDDEDGDDYDDEDDEGDDNDRGDTDLKELGRGRAR